MATFREEFHQQLLLKELPFRSDYLSVFWARDFEVWNWFFSIERNYDYMSFLSIPFKKKVCSQIGPEIVCVCACVFPLKLKSQVIIFHHPVWNVSWIASVVSCVTLSVAGSSVSLSLLAGWQILAEEMKPSQLLWDL